MSKRKGACAVVFRNTPEDAEFLVLHRINPWTGWEFPKGGIDEGETEEQTIQRELEEEIGTKNFKITEKTPFYLEYNWDEKTKEHYKDWYTGARHRVFLAEFIGKPDEIKVDDREHDTFKWLSADKLPEQLTFDDLRQVFKKVHDKYF